MPLDAQDLWDRNKVLLADEMIEMLSREISPLIAVPDADPRAPATEYAYADGGGTVGFIASVSRPFCLNCNRLRLTADGKMRYCLFAIEEDDVKWLMRSGASDDEIAALVRRNVAGNGWATRLIPPNSCRRRGPCIPSAARLALPLQDAFSKDDDAESLLCESSVPLLDEIGSPGTERWRSRRRTH